MGSKNKFSWSKMKTRIPYLTSYRLPPLPPVAFVDFWSTKLFKDAIFEKNYSGNKLNYKYQHIYIYLN